MSDELFELKEMVRKLEAKNAQLTEKNDKLEGKNAELMEKIDKMKEENESLKAENSQLKTPTKTESTDAIQTSQPVEGEKHKPKRFFKNWLLFDTLPWINRKELANSSMSTASETFQQLCWPKLHGNVKPHKIESLKISAAHLELGNFRALVHLRTGMGWRREEIIVPIASIPPLDYILGIERIEIKFVNDEVVNFFKSIENLLQNCKLQMAILNKKRNASASSMRSLMDSLASKIYLLRIGWQPRQPNELCLNEFNKFFPGFIDNIQFIQNWNSNPSIDEIDTILNWLTKQSKNGKQKLLEFRRHYDEKFMAIFISRINEEFYISNSPSNFLIAFECNENYEVFTHQENVRTNEILTIYRKNRDNGWGEHSNYYIIERYPKGEEHWKEDWENKIREYFRAENTSISINIDE